MADQRELIVQRMIDAGESEENIATVIQHFKTNPPPGAPAPAPALSTAPQWGMPTFASSNEKDAAGNATVDPNPGGTFLSHVGAQINPVTMARSMGNAVLHPIDTAYAVGAAQGAVFDKAKRAYDEGDYVQAGRHFINYLLPLVGPTLDQAGDEMGKGHYAAGTGDAVGLALAMFAGKPIGEAAAAAKIKLPGLLGRTKNPVDAAAVDFADAHGIPVDAGTATGRGYIKNVQKKAGSTWGGAETTEGARRAQIGALTRVGDELAGAVNAAPDGTPGPVVDPLRAGAGVTQALEGRIRTHDAAATKQYDYIRAREALPGNQVTMPGKATPMQALPDPMVGQLRRIVHELDAAPFTPRQIQPGKYGSSMEHVEGTGGAGAAVFDDIVQRAGSHATRGTVQSQLETYLGGGPETPLVKAALEVAGERGKARGGYTVSRPEMGPNVMDTPTRLEGQVTGVEMGFPVDVKAVKPALQAYIDELKHNLPVTQRDANPGLHALQQIVDGPDYGSLSQIDRDLGVIKGLARQHGGLAKVAVAQLEQQVMQAARHGGPDIVAALKQGRQSTIAKVAVQELRDQFSTEPGKVFTELTAKKDVAIERLNAVAQHAPEQLPGVGRAVLEDMLGMATEAGRFDHADKLYADWQKLGAHTKRMLFADQAPAIDQFLLVAKRLGENVNASGTAPVLTAMQFMVGIPGWAVAKMLYTPASVKALTRGLSFSLGGKPLSRAVQAAAYAEVATAARAAGVPLSLVPKAAGDQAPGASK